MLDFRSVCRMGLAEGLGRALGDLRFHETARAIQWMSGRSTLHGDRKSEGFVILHGVRRGRFVVSLDEDILLSLRVTHGAG